MKPDLHLLTGAYSLDALDTRERHEFERHLAACPDCAREVAEFRLTAGRLGAAIAEEPPEALRERVLAEIRRVRQEAPGGVRPLRRLAVSRSWAIGLTSAAAAIAVVLAVVFGAVAVHTQHQLSATQGELSAAAARYAPVARLLAAPDVRSVSANGTAGGNGTAVVSRSLDKGVFLASNMPAIPPGRTYQAWAIGVGNPRSIGLLSNGSPVVLDTLANAAKIAVTVEPAGGSRQPTSALVMLFSLPS